MATLLTKAIVIACMLLLTSPLEAQERLVFSRPESRTPEYGLVQERILKKAYSRIGIAIELLYLPVERALMTANNGETDGEVARIAGIELQYPNLIKIPVPLKYMEVVVYTKNVEFEVKGWQSLKPYTIGIVRGFKVAEFNTKGMNVEAVNTAELAFLKLDAGRNDIIVELRNSEYRLNKLDVSGIKILEPPLARIPLYHYLHKRHAALAVKLEKILTEMDQDGVIDSIRKKAKIFKNCVNDKGTDLNVVRDAILVMPSRPHRGNQADCLSLLTRLALVTARDSGSR